MGWRGKIGRTGEGNKAIQGGEKGGERGFRIGRREKQRERGRSTREAVNWKIWI